MLASNKFSGGNKVMFVMQAQTIPSLGGGFWACMGNSPEKLATPAGMKAGRSVASCQTPEDLLQASSMMTSSEEEHGAVFKCR
jgi:hypothetical protein